MRAPRLDARALTARILGSFPAGTYDLESILRVAEVRLSDAIATAAVTCEAAPVLLLNPVFVEEHCWTEERLFFLVMHEVYHLLLGHTRLFPRVTPIRNIVFDAIVNAVLARRFPGEAYLGLLRDLYDPGRVPDCVLVPPPGWPERMDIPATVPAGLAGAIRALYGAATGITYVELCETLVRHLGELRIAIVGGRGRGDDGEGVVDVEVELLGDHDLDRVPEAEDIASLDPCLREVLRRVVERWPRPPVPLGGRDLGGQVEETFLGKVAVEPEAASVLRRALRDLVTTGVGALRSRRRRPDEAPIRVETPLPRFSDRRAVAGWAWGEDPILFAGPLDARRAVPTTGLVHVYLDMSGSTRSFHSHLVGAVRPLVRERLVRLHQFSTQLMDLTVKDLAAGRVRSTGGTDIACVTRHMREERIARALVVTDGITGSPSRQDIEWLNERGGRVTVALTPDGQKTHLDGWATKFIQMPVAKGARA